MGTHPHQNSPRLGDARLTAGWAYSRYRRAAIRAATCPDGGHRGSRLTGRGASGPAGVRPAATDGRLVRFPSARTLASSTSLSACRSVVSSSHVAFAPSRRLPRGFAFGRDQERAPLALCHFGRLQAVLSSPGWTRSKPAYRRFLRIAQVLLAFWGRTVRALSRRLVDRIACDCEHWQRGTPCARRRVSSRRVR